MGFILAGLGNPGAKYHDTRHNIGFMVLDYLAGHYGLRFSANKWDGLMARARVWGEQVYFVKPETYMNRSGKAVAAISRFYNIPLQSLLVVHDDLDMAVGRVKLVKGGGAGGHNGICSLVEHLGSHDFYRLKIGIGRPGNSDVHPNMPVEKFVLSSFSDSEFQLINERIALLEEGIELLVTGDTRLAMNRLNSIK